MSSKDVYSKICKDLADSGIYIHPRDVYYLIYVVLKNIKEVCEDCDKVYLAKDKKITAKKIGKNLRIYLNEDYVPDTKVIRMSDKTSNKIFQDIFLPSILGLLDSEED